MILLSRYLRAALQKNQLARRSADCDRMPAPDPVPLLKLYNPIGPATWLATELDKDGDTLFGIADLGFGCPELGSFSVSEIASVHLPFGLRIERDAAFVTSHPLWSGPSVRAALAHCSTPRRCCATSIRIARCTARIAVGRQVESGNHDLTITEAVRMKMRSRFGRNRRGIRAGIWRRATSPEARPRVIFAPEVLMILCLPHAAFRHYVLACLRQQVTCMVCANSAWR